MLNNSKNNRFRILKKNCYKKLWLTDHVIKFIFDHKIETTICIVNYDDILCKKVYLVDNVNNLLAETILYDHEIERLKVINYMDDKRFKYITSYRGPQTIKGIHWVGTS